MEQPAEKHYELRNRSRSRSETPQVFNRTVTENESVEHHYDLRSRSRERSMTPGEVTSSNRRSTSRSLPSSVVKARTKAMDTISEQNNDTLTESTSETQSKSTAKTTRKSERRSERQRVKRQLLVNGPSELKDDSSDSRSETKEGHRESITPKRNMTSDYSSEEGDRDDSRPGSTYEFYKQQGDYWNKFPKTDYTYSQTSTCRYEVAPGVMAIPNMSRRSLRSDNSLYSGQSSSKASSNEDGSTMDASEIRRSLSDSVPQLLPHIRGNAGQSVVYKRTHVERYTTRREEYIFDSSADNQINEKYESWANPLMNSNSNTRYRGATNVDSDTELEDAMTSNHRSTYRSSIRQESTFSRITSLISTFIFTTLHLLTFNRFKKRDYPSSTSHYYRRYEESKWNRVRRQIVTLMQYMYLSLVKVGLLDSWLLSRASNIRDRVQGRRAKILWLVLLPLLLTIGAYVAHKHTNDCLIYLRNVRESVTESAPDFTNFTFIDNELYYKYLTTLKNVSLSDLPIVNVSLPSLPTFGWD